MKDPYFNHSYYIHRSSHCYRYPAEFSTRLKEIMMYSEEDCPKDPETYSSEDVLYALGRCFNILIGSVDIMDKVNLAFELDIPLAPTLKFLDELEVFLCYLQNKMVKYYVNYGGITDIRCPTTTCCLVTVSHLGKK